MVGDIPLLLRRSQVFVLAQPPPPSCSLFAILLEGKTACESEWWHKTCGTRKDCILMLLWKGQNQFRLKEEGRIVSQDPEVRVKHETCSTMCGTPVQVIWPKIMTELASGSKKVIIWTRMGLAYQNLELKWTPMTPQHTIDLSLLPGSEAKRKLILGHIALRELHSYTL